jgi:hypothetical protein
LNEKIVFEKLQNFDDDTTEYVTSQQLTLERLKQVEDQILTRYQDSADFKDKLERLPTENGRLTLKVKTEPESLVYSRTDNGTAFIVHCEDFDVKWHVSNLLQIALAVAGYEIKDSKF